LSSGAVVADHIRIGMGCEGSARRQSANRSPDQQRWYRSIWYGSNRAGRMAVTEHITGPSAHERRTSRSRQVEGHADPGGLLVGRSVDQGSYRWIAWSLHGRSPLGSERPRVYALRGVERPRRVVRFARFNASARPRLWAGLRRRRLRRRPQPALVATQGGAAAGETPGLDPFIGGAETARYGCSWAPWHWPSCPEAR
jgi:hypothetical protein